MSIVEQTSAYGGDTIEEFLTPVYVTESETKKQKKAEGSLPPIIVKDKDLNEIGMLDNAYNIGVKRRTNEVWSASFSMPIDDEKNNLCSHFNYIDITSASGRYYGLYRIMPTETKKSDNEVTYKCESVLSVLMDDIMDPPETNGYVQFTGQSTRTVLEGLLSFQETERIVLGLCEFDRYFDYAYENENGILNAIFDVPTRFGEPYEFKLDTSQFPWVLDLIRPSDEIVAEIRWGKDMKSFDEVSDPSEITNYLVMKGWGEGVNQLDISDANNGVRHLKDDESIAKWGKRSLIKVDRRFKDPHSLKGFGERLLNEHKDPKISFSCDSVDLSILPEYQHEQKVLNGVTRIVVEDKEYIARIIGDDVKLDKEYEVKYEIGNRITDISDSQADMERDIDVAKGYTNGSANYLSANETENADTSHPVKFRIWVPQDVVNINFMELTYESSAFRGYERSIKGGGGTTKSTTNGGSSTQTSTSGGGVSKSTATGGSSTQTSTSGGDHHHEIFILDVAQNSPAPTEWNVYTANSPSGYDVMYLPSSSPATVKTYSSSGDHSHSVSIPNHSHSFNIPNHAHDVSIPSHNHSVTIEPHTHDIDFGIYEHNTMPSELEIKVDGTVIQQTALNGENIDLIPYLSKDTNGKIQRGRWATVELKPVDELVRINATIVWGLFISSLKGVSL